MNKHTKYYVLIRYTILFFFVNLLLGFLQRTLQSLNLIINEVMNPLMDLIGVTKVLLVIAVVLGVIYLLYLVIMYYGSQFYSDYRITAIEGIYHGFIDIYHVYDKLKAYGVNNLQVDFKNSILSFNTKKGYYCLKFVDLFGQIEGNLTSEFWSSVSKPKKEYNQKVYTKKIRFPNPCKQNAIYAEELSNKTDKPYQDYVVISGFYKMKDKSDKILAPYEILDLLN